VRRPVGDRQVEPIAIRGLNRAIEPNAMHPAGEARNDLAPNRLDEPELFEDPELRRDGRTAATGSLGNCVIGRKVGAVVMVVEAP
jgi:hypothetical protein